MTQKITSVPKRPSTLPASGKHLWSQTCLHLIGSDHGLIPPQLPLIESFVAASIRLRGLREAGLTIDPTTTAGQGVLKLLQSTERHLLAVAGELKITPRAQSAQSAGPKGGRPAGTGTGALRAKAQQQKTGTDGNKVHWLEQARET